MWIICDKCEAEEALQGHHRLSPAHEPPGGTAQHSLPRSPELSAAAGSALHSALTAPFQGGTASARTPAHKIKKEGKSDVSMWRSLRHFLRHFCRRFVHESCICWGE